jgi:hypothetical protein
LEPVKPLKAVELLYGSGFPKDSMQVFLIHGANRLKAGKRRPLDDLELRIVTGY